MANASKLKVLRSVFLDPEMDELLRQAAFRLNISKGELIRGYVEQGLAEFKKVSTTTVSQKDLTVPETRKLMSSKTKLKRQLSGVSGKARVLG